MKKGKTVYEVIALGDATEKELKFIFTRILEEEKISKN